MGNEARRDSEGTAMAGSLTIGVRVPSTVGLVRINEFESKGPHALLTIIEQKQAFFGFAVFGHERGDLERCSVLAGLFALERLEQLEHIGVSPNSSSLAGDNLVQTLQNEALSARLLLGSVSLDSQHDEVRARTQTCPSKYRSLERLLLGPMGCT